MRIAAVMLAAAAGLLSLATAAQVGKKIAVLSLIGDQFLIVAHEAEIGTRVNRDRVDVVELPERAVDGAVALDMQRVIKGVDGAAEVVMLGPTRGLYAAQGNITEMPDVSQVVAVVKPSLEKAGIGRLVLITKLRHDAVLRLADGNVGSGKLEGAGFYLDQDLATMERGEGKAGRGFIAPFAYFRVSLVDVASGKVLGYRDVIASNAVVAGNSPSLQVWEALSAGQKVHMIRQLIDTEGGEAVRQLLAKPQETALGK
ncbi:MAG TPA: hypothetical protein VNU21_10600 [Usitatibacter sp.]|jgi:hypothetical protein|nr:hypothetical protein [Usitatibacter sp.]